MKKKLTAMLLAAMMLFSCAGVSMASTNIDAPATDVELTTGSDVTHTTTAMTAAEIVRVEKERQAYATYNSFLANTKSGLPQNYGGAYIDVNGDLVIAVVENAVSALSDTGVSLASSIDLNKVTIKNVENSYSELKAAQAAIGKLTTDKELGIASVALDEINNEVSVAVVGLNDEKQKAILSSVDKPTMVRIYNVDAAAVTDALPGGTKLFVKDSSSSSGWRNASLGLWVKNSSNQSGFLTAGHFMKRFSSGTSVYNNSTQVIGTTTSNYQYSGRTDAGFVKSSRSGDKTTSIDGRTINSYASSVLSGTTVYLRGAKNSDEGTITSTSVLVTYTSDNVTLNLVQASYTGESGDSGGLVYSQSGTSYAVFQGLHQGHLSSSVAYFSPASSIMSDLSLSLA